MDYKKDFNIKPKHVEKDGTVLFTDGTNDVIPNQLSCEAYGYNYDNQTGTCTSFIRNRKLDEDFSNITNKVQGENNKIQEGVHNSSVIGRNNTIYGENENCLISGQSNTINNGINNASVFGKMGKATHEGEVVIAGGGFNSEAGLLQHTEVQISNKTTDATVTSLYVQGGTTSHVFPPSNSICIYEMYLTVLCTGGSSGTAGHYKTEKHIGSILKENDNTQTLVSSSVTAISSSGNTGTAAIAVGAGDLGIVVNVTGAANRNLQWSATVHLYINKTNAVEI
jgi:hypothetical protein